MKTAHHYDYKTQIYQGESKVNKVDGYDEYILPQFSTWIAKPDFDKETEQAKFDVENQRWLVELKRIEVTAYHKQTKESKTFGDKSLVQDEYTLEIPTSFFDEFINGKWVLNKEKELAHNENAWVLEQMPIIDRNINYHLDNDDRAVSTEHDWRAYRSDLRNYVKDGKVTSETRPVQPK